MVIEWLPPFAAEYFAACVLIFSGLAEWLHSLRVRRLAALAFGPRERPSNWARSSPFLRAIAMCAVAWGLATLLTVAPRHYTAQEIGDEELAPGHILLVLDVSPSMRLVDAGPEKKQSRMARARELMESFFARAPIDRDRVTVVAVYNGAKPVVIDTRDLDVVRNILGDLPMHFAFRAGQTKLFAGLEEAARIAHPWEPRSTTLILLSDGDTVPATGMPKLPTSIRSTLVVGVGDPLVGKFIDGRQSRQDVSMLQQIAVRLAGTYHNGNDRQLPSDLIAMATGRDREDIFERLTRREYALIATILGAAILGLLPFVLHFFGTRWMPGKANPGRAGDLRATPSSSAGRPRQPSASTLLA